MRPPDPPPGWLGHVLRDGARTYLYRGRLRRLLGLPEGGPGVDFAAASAPPVGFRYLELPWSAEGSPVGLGALPVGQDPRLGQVEEPWSVPEGLAVPEDSGAGVAASSPPGSAAGEQTAAPVAECRGVEIPGISEVKRLFPALDEAGPAADAAPRAVGAPRRPAGSQPTAAPPAASQRATSQPAAVPREAGPLDAALPHVAAPDAALPSAASSPRPTVTAGQTGIRREQAAALEKPAAREQMDSDSGTCEPSSDPQMAETQRVAAALDAALSTAASAPRPPATARQTGTRQAKTAAMDKAPTIRQVERDSEISQPPDAAPPDAAQVQSTRADTIQAAASTVLPKARHAGSPVAVGRGGSSSPGSSADARSAAFEAAPRAAGAAAASRPTTAPPIASPPAASPRAALPDPATPNTAASSRSTAMAQPTGAGRADTAAGERVAVIGQLGATAPRPAAARRAAARQADIQPAALRSPPTSSSAVTRRNAAEGPVETEPECSRSVPASESLVLQPSAAVPASSAPEASMPPKSASPTSVSASSVPASSASTSAAFAPTAPESTEPASSIPPSSASLASAPASSVHALSAASVSVPASSASPAPELLTAPEPVPQPSGMLPIRRHPESEGIERLRRAVCRRVAKASPPSSDTSEPGARASSRPTSPVEPQPSAARRPAVVVAGVPPLRTPDAFWERSYLSHSLLRTPR